MLNNLVKFRAQVFNDKITSYGFEGDFHVKTESELELLHKISENIFRELYLSSDGRTIDLGDVSISDKIHVAVDTSSIDGYHENLEEFLNGNKYDVPRNDFYIHELEYIHSNEKRNETIENYK